MKQILIAVFLILNFTTVFADSNDLGNLAKRLVESGKEEFKVLAFPSVHGTAADFKLKGFKYQVFNNQYEGVHYLNVLFTPLKQDSFGSGSMRIDVLTEKLVMICPIRIIMHDPNSCNPESSKQHQALADQHLATVLSVLN